MTAKRSFADSVPRQDRPASDVLAEFRTLGVPVAEWARARRFNPSLVYRVLSGRQKCLRGQSHEIAVALGLKAGELGGLARLESKLAVKAAA